MREVQIKPWQSSGLRLRLPELVKPVTSLNINAREGPKSLKALEYHVFWKVQVPKSSKENSSAAIYLFTWKNNWLHAYMQMSQNLMYICKEVLQDQMNRKEKGHVKETSLLNILISNTWSSKGQPLPCGLKGFFLCPGKQSYKLHLKRPRRRIQVLGLHSSHWMSPSDSDQKKRHQFFIAQ